MTDIRINGSRKAWAAAGAAVLALVLSGCGEETRSAAETTSAPAPTSTAESTTTSPGTSAPASPTTPSTSANDPGAAPAPQQEAQPGLCTAGDVELSLGRGEGTAGTRYRPLQFTNVSGAPCVIQGFPGVSYVAGDDGHQVGPAAYRTGSEGASITLASGQTAHADVGFVQVHNYDPAQCKPTPVRGLRIYPPQETESLFVEAPGTGCASADIPGHQLTVATIEPGPA